MTDPTDPTDMDARLHRAGTAFRERPVPDVAIRWPSPPRRYRLLAPVVIAAAVALVVAGIAVGVEIRHAAAPAAPATPSPAVPAVPDPNFAVAAPTVAILGGGAPSLGPACRTGALSMSVKTLLTPEGIVGAISVLGSSCNITADASSIRLLDSVGQPLKVPSSKGNTVTPLTSTTVYSFGDEHGGRLSYGKHAPDLAATAARIGFAWSGTYCGPAATSIQLTIDGQRVSVPFSGPGLSCRPHASSMLIPGTLGGPGQGVIPPPLSWRALRARLVLPPTISPGPIPLVVVITNTGPSPVPLSNPCPTYYVSVSLKAGDEGTGSGGPYKTLCDQARTLRPGASVTLTLPSLAFPSTDNIQSLHVKSGDPLTVSWSIAGVPPATATTRIR